MLGQDSGHTSMRGWVGGIDSSGRVYFLRILSRLVDVGRRAVSASSAVIEVVGIAPTILRIA